VLARLDSEEFMVQAPAQVYAKLLEDGEYMCSTRTMYRVLADAHQVRERRAQRRHPEYKKPQLVATAPNQVWSWDTTKLPGPTKGTYFTLYVILDIFSRYIVGWQIAARESAAVAQELITACCKQQNVARDQLTIHADNGSPMVAKSTALLYVDLGIAKSHSRPHTSNDNPYSESNFRTIKYRPGCPSSSARSSTRVRSSARLSTGTTSTTITSDSRCCIPPTCTTAAPRPSSLRASSCSTMRTANTRSASCAAVPCRSCRQRQPGSTRRR
jgi:transposase InsO family protein